MSAEQILTLGLTGQAVYIDTPDGRPSAATVSIYDGRYREDDGQMPIVDAQTATPSTINTTVATTAAGASAANTRLVTVAATTGLTTGGWVKLTNASGQSEIVEVASVASGSFLTRQALAFDYPITTSTVVGARTSYTIGASLFGSTAWLGDENHLGGPYQVKWTLTGLTPSVRWTTFHLVRRAYAPIVGVLDMAPYFPDSADSEWVQQVGQRFQPQGDKAHELVRGWLTMRKIGLDDVREQQITKTLIEWTWLWLMAVAGVAPAGRAAQDQIEICKPEIARCLSAFGDGAGVPVDRDGNGAISTDERSYRVPKLAR